MSETTEVAHNPLNDNIELLDLPPTIFFAIKRHDPKIVTVGELLELNFSNIKNIGVAKLEILNNTVINYLKKHL